ncbi:MAG: hypothetical protein ACRD19_06380 [Terriglobia bacterium]
MNPRITDFSRRRFLSALSSAAGLLSIDPQAFAQLAQSPLAVRKDLYQIRDLSERQILQMYAHILEDACFYGASEWKVSSFDTTAGYWGNGVSIGNGGIRTTASMLLACATLLKYDRELDDARRQDLLDKSRAALRYATATHRTGTQKCTDGKPWGATPQFGSQSWQSGMWTGTLAIGAWLVWDQLDAPLRQAFQRVIAWEDDILAHRPPPNGLHGDTKAEENGWEVPCLVLGELMFPSHPHAAAWHEAALKYMMNTLCTEADTHDTAMVDGRRVDQWVKGANLYPDFTLENHNIFHPAYVACSCYFLTQAAMYFTYGGQLIPQAATHHLLDTWRMFQTIVLPSGETAYPQGMDWELRAVPYLNLYASLATHWKDPFAAHVEQSSLQYLRAWQKMGQGSLATPGSRLGFVRHAINAEQASYGFLAHKIFGPSVSAITAREAAVQEEGVRDYPYVEIVAHRTAKKFVSFSWKNRIMGLLMPIGAGHENNPDFTVPIQNGFRGFFELDPADSNSKPTVVEHSHRKTSDGFETTGSLLLQGGRLRQTLRMVSLGSQTVVYEDRVTALADVTVKSERGIPIGIENDEITGGRRVVSSHDGHTAFDWQKPQPPLGISGSWVNVDGRLGVVRVAGAGMTYVQAHQYSPGMCVYADVLYGSYSDRVRQFSAGEEVGRRIAVFFVEVTPEETSTLAQSCRIEERSNGQVLHFKQPGGKTTEVSLLSDDLLKK